MRFSPKLSLTSPPLAVNIVKHIQACLIPIDGVEKVMIEGRMLPVFDFQPFPNYPTQKIVEVSPGHHYGVAPLDPLQSVESRGPLHPLELAMEAMLFRVRQVESELYQLHTSVQTEIERKNKELERRLEALEHHEAVKVVELSSEAYSNSGRIVVDVGGTKFATTLDTLLKLPDTWFTKVLQSPNGGDQTLPPSYLFIDRDPSMFGFILNYLRDYPTSIEPKLAHLCDAERSSLKSEIVFYKLPLDLGCVFSSAKLPLQSEM